LIYYVVLKYSKMSIDKINQKEVVLVDKDGTLGYFYHLASGVFDGAKEFLAGQKKLKRRIYVATCGKKKRREELITIENNLDGFFASEDIDVLTNPYYENEQRVLKKIADDYVNREKLLSLTQRVEIQDRIYQRQEEFEELVERAKRIKINCDLSYEEKEERIDSLNNIINRLDFSNLKDETYLKQLVHKETGERLNPAKIYRNPNCKNVVFSKDINLTKRLISPQDYDSLRCVMVGDENDVEGSLSDPKTPLIVISQNVKYGDWGLVEIVVNKLFCDRLIETYEVFDELIGDESEKEVLIGNRKFVFCKQKIKEFKFEERGRVIYCP
jgi:hypothetical protein